MGDFGEFSKSCLLLFDDAGHRMVSTHASKKRVRYRYYASAPCIRGRTDEPVGSVTRVPAPDVEAAILRALKGADAFSKPSTVPRQALEEVVARIEVCKTQLAIHMKSCDAGCNANHDDLDGSLNDGMPAQPAPTNPRIILVPWKKPSKPFREILLPANTPAHRARPIKVERRATLIRAIGRGRIWLDEIVAANATVETLAQHQRCSVRQINLTISLAFLAPTLVSAAVEGRLPRGIGVAALRDAPAEWSKQLNRLGLAPTAGVKIPRHLAELGTGPLGTGNSAAETEAPNHL